MWKIDASTTLIELNWIELNIYVYVIKQLSEYLSTDVTSLLFYNLEFVITHSTMFGQLKNTLTYTIILIQIVVLLFRSPESS